MYKFLPILMLIMAACGQSDSSKKVELNGIVSYTIPGLKAVDVYGNFTNIGFNLDKNTYNGYQSWTCKRSIGLSDYVVVAQGPSSEKITDVSASVTFVKLGKDETEFLGYVASLPYKGSNPVAAKRWASNTLTNKDTTIGEVSLFISVSENSRTIKMYYSK